MEDIFQNGCLANQNANMSWSNIQISCKAIKLNLYQTFFYQIEQIG